MKPTEVLLAPEDRICVTMLVTQMRSSGARSTSSGRIQDRCAKVCLLYTSGQPLVVPHPARDATAGQIVQPLWPALITIGKGVVALGILE